MLTPCFGEVLEYASMSSDFFRFQVPQKRNSLKNRRAARATTTTTTGKNQEHPRERDRTPNFPGYPV